MHLTASIFNLSYLPEQIKETSKNSQIKACDKGKSGVY
jgi:hypothetical protein